VEYEENFYATQKARIEKKETMRLQGGERHEEVSEKQQTVQRENEELKLIVQLDDNQEKHQRVILQDKETTKHSPQHDWQIEEARDETEKQHIQTVVSNIQQQLKQLQVKDIQEDMQNKKRQPMTTKTDDTFSQGSETDQENDNINYSRDESENQQAIVVQIESNQSEVKAVIRQNKEQENHQIMNEVNDCIRNKLSAAKLNSAKELEKNNKKIYMSPQMKINSTQPVNIVLSEEQEKTEIICKHRTKKKKLKEKRETERNARKG
jgi:hypothetical protein